LTPTLTRSTYNKQHTLVTAPKTTTWPLDPHSRAKHAILRRYLEAWTPILSHGGFPRFTYLDGFAGPGQYVDGEDGSPIIALQVALAAKPTITSRIDYVFIEPDTGRAENLRLLVEKLRLPPTLHVTVASGETFEAAFSQHVRPKPTEPTFAFIDPFGWTGAPFGLVSEILSAPSSEVFVTFMFEEINRFLGLPNQAQSFDRLFGTPRWRDALGLARPADRKAFLRHLYETQLRARAKYVRSFEMRNDRDASDYFLYFATKSAKGLDKMKAAMWRVDPVGEFQFSDATNPAQRVLFSATADLSDLANQARAHFGLRLTTVRDIESFVCEATAYPSSFHKRLLRTLELESPPRLTVVGAPAKRRPGTFADPSLGVRFLPTV
jgi:three-Cys-motif partner protein